MTTMTPAEARKRLELAENWFLHTHGWKRLGKDTWQRPALWPWRKPYDHVSTGYAVNCTKLLINKRYRVGAEQRYIDSLEVEEKIVTLQKEIQERATVERQWLESGRLTDGGRTGSVRAHDEPRAEAVQRADHPSAAPEVPGSADAAGAAPVPVAGEAAREREEASEVRALRSHTEERHS